MAIFHMNFSNISAGKGRSAVASASYRSGEKLYSEMENKTYFYDRSIMPESFILLPENAPEWAKDRQKLWNEVEAVDRKVNSRYAKEFNVALPIELSEDEQKELLTEYVQKTFVDKGMVADVAIHRDHDENPHAHVMLTNRPFNADGSWGQKAKKEYILDENGNKTYTANGHARSRKIWLVDWDKVGKVEEWRKAWADHVNSVFQEKNIDERISEKTLEAQGINDIATQHVGVTGNRDERAEFNKLVLENRQHKAELENLDEKINNELKVKQLKNFYSFNEKKVIAELSKELHTFIDLEHLEEKNKMLFNWKNSVLIKQIVGKDVSEELNKVSRQEFSLDNANRLIDKVVDRSIKAMYPTVDSNAFSIPEKRQLIRETESENKVFTGAELDDRLSMIRADSLNRQIVALTKRPFTSLTMLSKQEKYHIDNINNVLAYQGYSYENIEMSHGKILRNYESEEFSKELDIIQRSLKQISSIEEVRKIVEQQYSVVLGTIFPDSELNKLSLVEKEKTYNAVIYFNPTIKKLTQSELENIVKEPPILFSTKEHNQGLSYLAGRIRLEDINNKHLTRVLKFEGTKKLFIGEAKADKNIDPELLKEATNRNDKQSYKNEFYRDKNMENYQSVAYSDTSPAEYMNRLFSGVLISVLYNNENQHKKGLEEVEWDMERKHREHTKTGGLSR